MSLLLPAKQLDEKKRCCGRKPIVYKYPHPRLYCSRCYAAFHPETGQQIPNWAFAETDGGFIAKYSL